jgi:K+-sensing histidine kinase KdpD
MMKQFLNWRTLLILAALAIISGTIYYSQYLAKKIEREEKQRIAEWIEAQKLMTNTTEAQALALSNLINNNNDDLPLIATDEHGQILESKNLDSLKTKTDSSYVKQKLEAFKKLNTPQNYDIDIDSLSLHYKYKVYHGNTKLLNEIKYYPYIQLLIVALFAIVAWSLIKTQFKSTQNQVWAGMAKETAHQMGTPLTSLQGWMEILRDKDGMQDILPEMEKDVNRLKLVSDRFGKIGSKPQLQNTNLNEQIAGMVDYIKRRASGRVTIHFEQPEQAVMAMISPPLFDWVIENLLKNALDAIEGNGSIMVTLSANPDNAIIDVKDTGKGISAANLSKVFKPGFTTKKRGWGLGLTLCKRIMEQYHKGSLTVKHTEPGKGTTFRVVVK